MRTLVVFALLVLACHAFQRTQTHQGKNAHMRGHTSHKLKTQKQLASTKLYNKAGHQVFRSLTKGFPCPIASDEYTGGDKAADDMKVFAAGFDKVAQILDTITQFDDSSTTRYDEDRCGAAVTVAAAINAGLVGPLIDFISTTPSKPNAPLPNTGSRFLLTQIKNRFNDKSATYGDIGQLEDILYEHWSVVSGTDHTGMVGGQLHNLFVGMGIPEPDATVDASTANFDKGKSWPYIIHIASGSDAPTAIHWILLGGDADTGNQFIYDPYSMRDNGPLFTACADLTPPPVVASNTFYHEYQTWIMNSAQTGSGWAPRNQDDATRDIQREGF